MKGGENLLKTLQAIYSRVIQHYYFISLKLLLEANNIAVQLECNHKDAASLLWIWKHSYMVQM